jgi:PAS domain S-box-containing protein
MSAVQSDTSGPLAHLHHLVVLCPIAIANLDARHRVQYCNPAFEKLFRYRTSEAVGQELELLLGLEEKKDVAAALRHVHGKPVHVTTQARRSDETPVDVEVHLIPKRRTGPFAGCWGVFQDLTALGNAEAMLSRLTQTMIEAQERQRFDMATALHDDVAQRLTVLQIGIERLKTDLPPARAAFKAQLEKLQTEAKGISASVRALSFDLDVPTIELIAIDKALERLCDDVAARGGITVHFTSSHAPRSVPHDVSLALFRVVQDALSLSEQSGARPVRIMLTGTAGMIQLDIRDLGSVRIDESDVGLRVLTMRERVAMVNGTFSIGDAPKGATEIDIRIPLPRD